MGVLPLAVVVLAACGQPQITGFTYSCPAIYLSDQYADKTGNMLADGQTGSSHTVIYRANSPALTLSLPGLYRIDRVVAHCHRHNDNYKCRALQLYVQQGGLWLQVDEKPGFLQPFESGHNDFAIELEGKGMTTEALRVAFLAASILSISEIQVFGAPAETGPTGAAAELAKRPPAERAAVAEVDADGDGKLDLMLENRWVRLVASPARGGVVRSFIYHPAGTDLVCAQGANFGLLREQLWKPQYFFADNPCSADKGQGDGSAWVETRLTGAGGMMSFTHARKRLLLRDDSPVLQVEWEIQNDPSSMTEYEYGPWMHNWVGRPGAVTRYFVPTVEGVQEFRLEPGKLKDGVDLWYWEPARGWMALVSDPEAEGRPAPGLAVLVPYPNLACFYQWAGISSPAATAEWRHGLVKLAAGQSFTARYLVVPFHGLARVDGVCPLPAPGAADVAGSAAIGCIEAAEEGGKVSARVQVFVPAGAPAASAAVSWRPYPDGEDRELGRKPLAEGAVTDVFAGETPGAAGAPALVSCRVIVGDQVVGDFERLLHFGTARVAYRLEPREKRTARVESQDTSALPRHDLQSSIVTPHVPWGRPHVNGPIRALVLCDDQNAREVIELAQRLDVDVTYIKFRTNREKEWIYQGDRTVPNLETAQKRLLEALDKPLDVAVIAGFDWQVHFTPEIRAKLADKVQGGMGLVAIEPCGVPADDPLVNALGISEDDRPLGRFYTWKAGSMDDIGRGLPWEWADEAMALLVPRTRRMEYSRPPQGVGGYYAEDGVPLLAASEVGKGRVVTATYDVLTHVMSYRGFSALTPAISYRGALLQPEYEQMTWPYWEHWWVLITRMVVWAAGKEGPAHLVGLSARLSDEGHVVAGLTAEGDTAAPLSATLQLTDKFGTPITAGAAPGGDDRAAALCQGFWTPSLLRGAESPDDLSYLRFGARQVEVRPGQQTSVDLGAARAGWNFVRVILRDANSRAAMDWALLPVNNARPAAAVKSLTVDRDPVTDCRTLVAEGQPWARVFVPEQPLGLTVELEAVLALEPGLRVRAELYDTHGRLLFAEEKPVGARAEPLEFSFAPPELRNMGLEWRVTLLRGQGEAAQTLDTARRRLIALPARDWGRLTFTSWSANFLTRCLWLHQYLTPLVQELGVDVGMDSVSELTSGKVYRNKWQNIEHSYIGLLDYAGRGVPGFRDAKFAEKSAKYAQTKDHALLVREPCLHDPEYLDKLAGALRDRVAEAAKVGLPYDYCMGDEMSLTHYTSYYDYCFSPNTLAAFRDWLKARYKSLDDLNRDWETAFAAWEDVVPMTLDEVRGRANAAPWAEFRTFMNDSLAAYYAFVQKTIREVDPEAKCGLSGTQEPKPGNGMDWWKLSSAFSYYHSYNTGWSNEMRRSFAPATGVMQTPYYAGYWQSGRALEYNMFWCLLHDTKSVSCWTTPLLLYPDFTLTEAGEDTRRFVHELREGPWDYVRGGRRLQDGIAIHYSQPSIQAALLIDHDSHIVKVRDAWVKLIEDLGLQYDFVAYEQVEKGELTRQAGRYRVLILPESIALSSQEVAEIRKFALAGGTVIADGWCGLMDERCRRLERPALDDLFGVSRGEEAEPAESVTVSAGLAGEALGLRLRPAETGLRAAGQPLGDSGGIPVLVSSQAGKGKAWYLNLDLSSWPLDRQTGSPNEAAVRRVVASVLAQAGVKAPIEVAYQSGKQPHVEVIRYRIEEPTRRGAEVHREPGDPGAGLIVGLLRDRGDSADEVATVSWGQERHVYDLRAHRYLGRLASLSAPLAPGECRLLLLTASELPAPAVGLAGDTARRGSRVEVTAARPTATAVHQMVRLEVLGPDGAPLSDYARNLLLRGESVPVGFAVALNDPLGRWTVRLSDLASGRTAQAAVTVAE